MFNKLGLSGNNVNPWYTPRRGLEEAREDYNIYPKFFTVSPTLIHYREIPFPKSSRWEMFQEKKMGLWGYSDLTQLDYPVHYMVSTAHAFQVTPTHMAPNIALETTTVPRIFFHFCCPPIMGRMGATATTLQTLLGSINKAWQLLAKLALSDSHRHGYILFQATTSGFSENKALSASLFTSPFIVASLLCPTVDSATAAPQQTPSVTNLPSFIILFSAHHIPLSCPLQIPPHLHVYCQPSHPPILSLWFPGIMQWNAKCKNATPKKPIYTSPINTVYIFMQLHNSNPAPFFWTQICFSNLPLLRDSLKSCLSAFSSCGKLLICSELLLDLGPHLSPS